MTSLWQRFKRQRPWAKFLEIQALGLMLLALSLVRQSTSVLIQAPAVKALLADAITELLQRRGQVAPLQRGRAGHRSIIAHRRPAPPSASRQQAFSHGERKYSQVDGVRAAMAL